MKSRKNCDKMLLYIESDMSLERYTFSNSCRFLQFNSVFSKDFPVLLLFLSIKWKTRRYSCQPYRRICSHFTDSSRKIRRERPPVADRSLPRRYASLSGRIRPSVEMVTTCSGRLRPDCSSAV